VREPEERKVVVLEGVMRGAPLFARPVEPRGRQTVRLRAGARPPAQSLHRPRYPQARIHAGPVPALEPEAHGSPARRAAVPDRRWASLPSEGPRRPCVPGMKAGWCRNDPTL